MKTINWKLVLKLSMFGLVMAISTVFWISSNTEPILWFLIFPLSAYMISKYADSKYFLHGFLLGLANCVWITAAHIVFINQYLANHQQEAQLMLNSSLSPALMMLMTGPVIGIVSGVVFGLFAIVLNKVLKKAELTKKRRENNYQ